MKKLLCILILFVLCQSKIYANSFSNYITNVTEYESSVTFSAGYAIGDYIEFLKVSPISAAASGYYQISISYTRNGVASGASHLASISHSNPTIWRETGRVNNNPYVGIWTNFTVDCNTDYSGPRFRIRAVNTMGVLSSDLTVYIKVTSININNSYTSINNRGNDTTVSKFLPMTSEWDLYVGNVFSSNDASLAIKAIQNGNVGIGTAIPDEKLTVKGKIHTQEVRVDMAGPLVPDFVFANDYKLKSLEEVEDFIKENNHLPEIPSSQEIEKNGLMLAEMNMSLLKKIEEMTLYMIEQNKKINELEKQNTKFTDLEKRLEKIEANSN